MPKLLIAIVSCQRDRPLHDRRRPLPSDAELKYFIGGSKPETVRENEVWLDVADDYLGLSAKVRDVCRYLLAGDWTHMLKADNDSVIAVKRINDSGYENHDYVGEFSGETAIGAGYILSRRAAELVVRHEPDHIYEDANTARALRGHEIRKLACRLCEHPQKELDVMCKTCRRPTIPGTFLCGLHAEPHPPDFVPVCLGFYHGTTIKKLTWISKDKAADLVWRRVAEYIREAT